MPIDMGQFANPDAKYRINPMTQHWPEDRKLLMRAIKDYGYGGVVTNVPLRNGFTHNPDNLAQFGAIVKDLEETGLRYWIYDEHGCPSGIGDEKTIEGHPELEAKGFYVRRFVAFEPRRMDYTLDGESDKIVWAARYPLQIKSLEVAGNYWLEAERMEAVPFTANSVSCELRQFDALFVFCVKSAPGHMNTNPPALIRNINIMDPRAVRRFIDLCYEPVERAAPGAYRNAIAVFTDEPSLETTYVRGYESRPFSLAPWVDGLFEEFEAEYGFPLPPWLPFLFEGNLRDCCGIRVKFYTLVGKLITRAYTAQLSDWCGAHGVAFSGHYCGEDYIAWHVRFYGDMMEVMKRADYPGIDLLVCVPEYYGGCGTMKYTQMAVRKNQTNGMMAELNPWMYFKEFEKCPLENVVGTINLLYLGGGRVVNSFFYSDYSDYDESLRGETGNDWQDMYEEIRGFIGRSDSIWLNEYVGRIGYMLDNLHNQAGIFVYYGIEDAQAKIKPDDGIWAFTTDSPDSDADNDTEPLTKAVYQAGHDYYFADRDDLAAAAESLAAGRPMISGCEVKTVIVPALDVMYDESLQALAKLSGAGVSVLFHKKLPIYGIGIGIGTAGCIAAHTERYSPCTTEFVLESLASQEAAAGGFSARVKRVDCADGEIHSDAVLIKAQYLRDGKEMHFICNNSRAAADVLFEHTGKTDATLYNPADGSATPIRMGDSHTLPSFRGVFVVFD